MGRKVSRGLSGWATGGMVAGEGGGWCGVERSRVGGASEAPMVVSECECECGSVRARGSVGD